ncbi:MAG: biotin--[acetyl-CoA-carboxylase] ligase [Dysgonamonadaceae bacterium]|nr:biotin--[acetyl-CoA-carboxylase] ligase [Dysgonamonadaceae bacterium]
MLFDIVYYKTLPSSNNEAIRLASADAPEGTVVVCCEQTAGRGQRNNCWVSAPGENLTMSLILRPADIAADELFLLSKAFSLAVVRSLNCYGINASIKWPNDIYAETRKIAGILIEHSFWGNDLMFSVVGLGLNVNQVSFPPLDIVPTSMVAETGKDYYDINEILSSILNCFSSSYKSDKETIHNGYMEKLYRRKGCFPYRTKNGEMLVAEIHNVASSGELILKDVNGVFNSFLFKEITYL